MPCGSASWPTLEPLAAAPPGLNSNALPQYLQTCTKISNGGASTKISNGEPLQGLPMEEPLQGLPMRKRLSDFQWRSLAPPGLTSNSLRQRLQA